MTSFSNIIQTFGGFGQQISKKANHVTADVGQAIHSLGQAKHIAPSTFRSLENFGERAGEFVDFSAENMQKGLVGVCDEVGKHAGPAAGGDWKVLDGFGQEDGNRIGGMAEDVKRTNWETIGADVKDWVKEHPRQTAGIAVGILAPPLAVAATPMILGGIGFTAGGVLSGSAAAAAQTAIGNVAAGSAFAILQSAAAGGSGAAIVNGIVGGTVAVVAVGANLPGLIHTFNKEKHGQTQK